MSSARVAFAGTPEFSVPTLNALSTAGFELVGVLTQPDRPKGRGQQSAPTPIKVMAQALGIPVDQPDSLKTSAGRECLERWQPDLLVVVAYGLLLPHEVLRLPRLGCVNVHASLLPRWRGAAPIQRAILAGDQETGVTIMQMDIGLDTGAMYRRRAIPIRQSDTSGSLFGRLAEIGAETLIETLPAIVAGNARAEPQPTDGVCYAHKLDKAEARIDWNADAWEVSRRIRAFDPWPVAETHWKGDPIKLRSVTIDDESSKGDSGRVLALSGGALIVQCGRGTVAIEQWQRAGRRSLSAAEFANGTPIIGELLGANVI